MKIFARTPRLRASILLLLALVVPAAYSQENTVAVVNAASFQAKWPVAPGALASAFGAFPGVTTGEAETLPLPTAINGVEVRINGVAAPLLYVSESQINFQVPQTTPITVTSLTEEVTVEVAVGSSVVASGKMAVAPVSPAIFILDTLNPLMPGAILSERSELSPIRRGEVIQIFGTGAGADLSSPVLDGTAAGANPLVTTTKDIKVFIFQQEAEQVEFTGLSPEFVGLWQVNVRIPDLEFISGPVTVQILYDGLLSNTVTITVED